MAKIPVSSTNIIRLPEANRHSNSQLTIVRVPITIADDDEKSLPILVDRYALVAVGYPAAMDGDLLRLYVSHEGTAFVPENLVPLMYIESDVAVLVDVPILVNRIITLEGAWVTMGAGPWLQIETTTAGTAEAQLADRIISLGFRPI